MGALSMLHLHPTRVSCRAAGLKLFQQASSLEQTLCDTTDCIDKISFHQNRFTQFRAIVVSGHYMIPALEGHSSNGNRPLAVVDCWTETVVVPSAASV